jgi:4-aminobutyrate aminotransferase-like enzyme/Ser/Thr protein kinase RdoA (MazF antagonist)
MYLVKEVFSGISVERAEEVVRELYGFRGRARPLTGEHNYNFHVRDDEGREFVLKIHPEKENLDGLDFEDQVQERLAERISSVSWPRVQSTTSGKRIAFIRDNDGVERPVRLLTYLPGEILGEVQPYSPHLMRGLGRFIGNLDRALEDFSHPAMHRDLEWYVDNSPAIIREELKEHSPSRQAILELFLERYERCTAPVLPGLRSAVIHNDANDMNTVVSLTPEMELEISGLVDFGDMVHTYTVCEPANAASYVLLEKEEPLATAAHVVRGYHEVVPLTEPEVDVLFDLICMRMCTEVSLASFRRRLNPKNEYNYLGEETDWEALEKLAKIPPELATGVFRDACGLPPCAKTARVIRWLEGERDRIGPLTEPDVRSSSRVVFDLSVGSPDLPGDPANMGTEELTRLLAEKMKEAGAAVGVGRYNEARLLHTGESPPPPADELPEHRTVHLGLDLFLEVGSSVLAPLDGTLHSLGDNSKDSSGGPTIILEHAAGEDSTTFFTLYEGLSQDSLKNLKEGARVRKGDALGRIGTASENGDRPPHLHFQIVCDLMGRRGFFPNAARPSEREVWLGFCPDPNLVAGLPEEKLSGATTTEEISKRRQRALGEFLYTNYRKPLHFVRGFGQFLYDEEGRAYVDAINNVPHVGHSHPHVVRAAQRQMAVLNTNTRYLHEHAVRYAERLAGSMPEPLRRCTFVCSGSEANELALRLARAHTGGTDVIVHEGVYHGLTCALTDISPAEVDDFGREGGEAEHVHLVPPPDTYRGEFRSNDPEAGRKYAADVAETIKKLQAKGRKLAAFFSESHPCSPGLIFPPPGYMQEVLRAVHEAGGIFVSDQVQVGFGRLGTHFWGFEENGVVPDVVTMGKPIGNGHPLGAVVTTPELAASLAAKTGFFSTCGGNPVSCAVGMAVLDVLEDEQLQAHALRVGKRLLKGLEELKKDFPIIGDVRGSGLYHGIELVLNRETLEPAEDEATYVLERLKDHGILVAVEGLFFNILKIRPPMPFSEQDADRLVETLDKILDEESVQLD